MAKDKRSRSRGPSEDNRDPASRSTSMATAVKVPLPSSSPTSESAPGSSSDPEEELQADSIRDVGKSSQDADTPQEHDASQASEAPVLTDDGGLASPQIEPGIVEDSANDLPPGDSRSPTGTDSTSPDKSRTQFNLGAELEGASFDGSDEDVQADEGDQPSSASAAQTDVSPLAGEPQEPHGADSEQRAPGKGVVGDLGPSDAKPGRGEDIQVEKKKRLAAEKRSKELETKLQEVREKAEKAREHFASELERVTRAWEADRVKFEKKNLNLNDQPNNEDVLTYETNLERLTADVEAPGRSATGDDALGGVSSGMKQATDENEELAQAIKDEINEPTAALPTAPKSDLSPGSARFLLAEYEYLLDKKSPVFNALWAVADYADGGGALPSSKATDLFDAFGVQLTVLHTSMEKCTNAEQAENCLKGSIDDWNRVLRLSGVSSDEEA